LVIDINKYTNFTVIDHPLIQHKLTYMRSVETSKKEFKELVDEVSMLMLYGITKDLPLTSVKIKTPMCTTESFVISGKKIVFVPILRAGLGMVDGVLQLVPSARIGHLGIYRDHGTLSPIPYYFKIPSDSRDRLLILLDPMLATGGSAVAAVDMLKKEGAEKIKFMCIVSAPEGVKKLCEAHPDIMVYAASLDEKLDEDGYIVPGLGDAGDRLFGTK